MPVFRINKSRNYTIMSNYHLRDKKLSFKAKGLISYMLSLPDDWDYSLNGLCKVSKDNLTSIRSALKELRENNYLEISRIKNAKGQFEWIYSVFENPKPSIDFLYMDNLSMENLSTENHTLLNTNNKILKKNKKKKENDNKKQDIGFLGVEFQNAEKQIELNTKNKKSKANKVSNTDYEQREYTKEDLEKFYM